MDYNIWLNAEQQKMERGRIKIRKEKLEGFFTFFLIGFTYFCLQVYAFFLYKNVMSLDALSIDFPAVPGWNNI